MSKSSINYKNGFYPELILWKGTIVTKDNTDNTEYCASPNSKNLFWTQNRCGLQFYTMLHDISATSRSLDEKDLKRLKTKMTGNVHATESH